MGTKFTDLPAGTPALTDVVPYDALSGPTTKKSTWATVRSVFFPAVLTADVSGVLPVANGGTGVSSLTLPASGLVVGTTDAQTLTNKTINGASNTLTVRIASDVSGLGSGISTMLGTGLGAGVGTWMGVPTATNFESALVGTISANRVVQATGTGIPHVVAGVLTAASSLIVNADVSASAAIAVSKLAPSGTNGWVLTTTAGVPVWAAAAAGSPGGSTTQVQYNNAGAFAGDAGMTYDAANDALTVVGKYIQGSAPSSTGQFCGSSQMLFTHSVGGVDRNVIEGTSAADVILGDPANGGSVINRAPSGQLIYNQVGGNNIMTVGADGVQVGSSTLAFGSGSSGMLGVTNATTVPTTNPVGGGVMYAQAGAAKWRGSGGTVTTFGPADPHCPHCGRDFAVEHQNETLGEHLALCLPCLVDALQGAGIDTAKFTITDVRGATKDQWDVNHAAAKARDAAAAQAEVSSIPRKTS